MTILELEQLTQLERATIRYYEREGLITPNRKENSYRDYSDEDAKEILKIKLLRQLDLPIDTIKQLQQGSANITDVLRKQASTLEKEIESTQRAADICKEISENAITYQNLDAVHYLDKLTQDPDPTVPEKKASVWDPIVEYHPVRRFIARMADYALLRVIVRFIVIVIFRVRPLSEFWSNVIDYGCLLLSVPLQAILLHCFATTPGKWLMGIQVFSYKGRKLDIANAMQREWDALFYGYGLGIPIVRLWRLYRSYKEHKDRERLHQDIGIDHVYSYWEFFWNGWKKTIFAAFCIIIILTNYVNVTDAIRPKYRGNDLSIAEFAENYNFYADLFEVNGTMNPDGTWYVSPSKNNGAIIVIGGGQTEKVNEPLRFETEGERIHRITYQNSWHDIDILLQPLSDQMITACITTAASQNDISVSELLNFIKLIEEYEDDEVAEIRYKNIEIRWTFESTNCTFSLGKYWSEDNGKTSSVTANFEIIIH